MKHTRFFKFCIADNWNYRRRKHRKQSFLHNACKFDIKFEWTSFFIDWANRKIIKKSRFFCLFDFEVLNDNDDEKTLKSCRSISFKLSFAEKYCLFWNIFFALRFKIAISFDELIKKSKTIATKENYYFFSKLILTRKISWIIFSTKTFKSKVLKSRMIEKIINKSEKNIETMSKKHL